MPPLEAVSPAGGLVQLLAHGLPEVPVGVPQQVCSDAGAAARKQDQLR